MSTPRCLGAGRLAVVGLPCLWLCLFFLAPFAIVLKIALAEAAEGVPPYAAMLDWAGGALPYVRLHLGNFRTLLEDPFYAEAFLRSLRVAAISASLCLLAGYPMALAISRTSARARALLLLLVMLPFWSSFLLRISAWIAILQDGGIINSMLVGLGLVSQPMALLYTDTAMYVGIVYCYLPFMVLPLYANLVQLDTALLEAASDLGARPWRAFLAVTLPLSLPGVVAGFMLVFIPALGEFVIPELLGGPDAQLIGRVLWTEFFQNRDWPLASALAVALLLLLVAPIMLFQHERKAVRV
ncbi:MAG: ABC transporter permease subunit [Acetobacteraceae bacterium]|nr:ABC transporter permease subunit [Acetobacteraceae bacterium]